MSRCVCGGLQKVERPIVLPPSLQGGAADGFSHPGNAAGLRYVGPPSSMQL